MFNKRYASFRHIRKRRLKRKAIVTLFIILICIGAVSAFSIYHFGVHEIAPKSSHVSTVKAAKAAVSASSSKPSPTFEISNPIQASQISLQDAAKPLWINVSIENQIVTVYDANNKIVESYICSTGSPGYNTPTGAFTVYNRGKSFFSQKYQEGGYYWVAFYKDYYFHSVPFDKNGKIIPTIANDLGHEDSHGCVHLAIPNSEWIYDNIPNGTKVVIE
jgi:lipoprotein-anchoring transpeptidase ErfK/SrfK